MIGRIFERVLDGFSFLSGSVLIFMSISINIEVIMRYCFNRPTSWAVDFNGYALIYMTFLSAAWVLKKDGHVKIEILLDYLPKKVQRILNVITSAIGASLSAIFTWYSLQIMLEALRQKEMFVESVIVPRWPILMVMPIGAFLLVLQFIRRGWLQALSDS